MTSSYSLIRWNDRDEGDDFSFFKESAPQDAQDSHDIQDRQDSNGQPEKDKRPSAGVSRGLLKLPLKEYITILLDFCYKLRASDSKEAQRSGLFTFARFCKAHPAMINLSDDQAMQRVEEVLLQIESLPEGHDPWEVFFPEGENGKGVDGETARLDFMCSWVSVRHIPFHDVLQRAFSLSCTNPIEPRCHRGELYKRFISVAGWLQALRPNDSIYLPTRLIGDLLACDQRTVSRLRKLAMEDKLLTMIRESSFRPRGKCEATEFRFAIEEFEELRAWNDSNREISEVRPAAEQTP